MIYLLICMILFLVKKIKYVFYKLVGSKTTLDRYWMDQKYFSKHLPLLAFHPNVNFIADVSPKREGNIFKWQYFTNIEL